MSLEYLGNDIDIHTGGEDNKFPHHENEIAQSEAATGRTFVRYWMHNAWLKLQGEKMAKREGEQITLDTLTEKGFSPLSFRLLVFGSHYRSPVEFSWEGLEAASRNLETIRNVARDHPLPPAQAGVLPLPAKPAGRLQGEKSAVDTFAEALADDLNTPRALAVFMDALHAVNRNEEDFAVLEKMDEVLGIFEPLKQEIEATQVPEEIQKLAEEREAARKARDFQRSDELRTEIENAGWRVEDTAIGPRLAKL